jgi:hypothetical protein
VGADGQVEAVEDSGDAVEAAVALEGFWWGRRAGDLEEVDGCQQLDDS